jgi:hypothetical protein
MMKFSWMHDALRWAEQQNVVGRFTVQILWAGEAEIWRNQFNKWSWEWK